MKYKVIRTETADVQIRKIILYIAENFGNAVALEKLKLEGKNSLPEKKKKPLIIKFLLQFCNPNVMKL